MVDHGERGHVPVVATMAQPQPAVPHPDSVTVAPGETLYGVARQYGVPVRSVIEVNRLEPPYRLTAGQRLTLPQVRQHIVQPGETLYAISRAYGVDTSTLARRNGLEPPYRVRVGEVLVLPASVETPVIQATAPAAAYAAPALAA
ncbi:MAG TPA: LysM domain-containing protein, partial [Stellaceae bacterium]|nr:LysM domain-containing protein [Stellaceae bacterium]